MCGCGTHQTYEHIHVHGILHTDTFLSSQLLKYGQVSEREGEIMIQTKRVLLQMLPLKCKGRLRVTDTKGVR